MRVLGSSATAGLLSFLLNSIFIFDIFIVVIQVTNLIDLKAF